MRLDDLLQLLLLAEPVPPDALEESVRRLQRHAFAGHYRIAHGDEKVVAPFQEVF
jgi:hypothetical protein